ncbi:SidA/IucD/PvdA family monooxygenase [Nannocystis sp. SCPEA4]|uniref:lysine N(6)-hydroxylase/L-ornithine N(5)-oxygenase family protein n=1 Tax=Nannocystis sp. SCPEA4 TaxID=2996787 RepID=UPI00226F690B|nr:SidA/IucD/PvdA family monooxygenase [Nannocystis sp. SCPEA4]MCY1055052.1 SidA/IucD/PvdA family monooxygenase [Nannocystis sp. SCPEA4]
MNDEIDLAGVGIGPFNLSIAALADELPELRTRFFERRERFAWHPGLLFPGSRMQTSFLKDLVTAVSPTSPHSFINYLVQHGRFHAFLAAESSAIERLEFADYLGWVAGRLSSLRFGVEVRDVRAVPGGFELRHDHGRTLARHVVLGTGRVPAVPECARPHLGPKCFHAIDILARPLHLQGARVAVVGGGQTGAEVVLELLRGTWGEVAELAWVSRRLNFEPLDESPFTNHLFTPGFVAAFRDLDGPRRQSLLARHKLAGDGISLSTLRDLHDRIYQLAALRTGPRVELLPGRELLALTPHGDGFELLARNNLDGEHEALAADVVILCTGLREHLPGCIESLLPELERDEHGDLQVDANFELRRRRRRDERLYIVNGGRTTHGIAESQLSLMAWRSAVILNDVLGRRRFAVEQERELVRWRARPREDARSR